MIALRSSSVRLEKSDSNKCVFLMAWAGSIAPLGNVRTRPLQDLIKEPRGPLKQTLVDLQDHQMKELQRSSKGAPKEL